MQLKNSIRIKLQAQKRLSIRKLAYFIKNRLNKLFFTIKIGSKNTISASKDERESSKVLNDANIFSSCLNQYLYLLGHLSNKA